MFCYCAESRRAARLLTARYDCALAGAGLSASQFELLSVISGRKVSSAVRLAEALAIDATTLSRNLRSLVTAKLVRACKSKQDARQMLYSLTNAGERRLSAAEPLWTQAHRSTFEQLGLLADPAKAALQGMNAALRR